LRGLEIVGEMCGHLGREFWIIFGHLGKVLDTVFKLASPVTSRCAGRADQS
jgi:hypothetical protein